MYLCGMEGTLYCSGCCGDELRLQERALQGSAWARQFHMEMRAWVLYSSDGLGQEIPNQGGEKKLKMGGDNLSAQGQAPVQKHTPTLGSLGWVQHGHLGIQIQVESPSWVPGSA